MAYVVRVMLCLNNSKNAINEVKASRNGEGGVVGRACVADGSITIGTATATTTTTTTTATTTTTTATTTTTTTTTSSSSSSSRDNGYHDQINFT